MTGICENRSIKMSPIKLFYDLLSQPSRALYIFAKITKIPFESCPVALRKGEHLSEDFKDNFNKFRRVPFIHEGNFRLSESVAIARYLSRKFGDSIPDHWYPKDSIEQAKVDEYLEWQHLNTRAHCASYFQTKFIIPLMTGKAPDPKQIERLEKNMTACVDQIEELFLSQGHEYIVNDKISIADIFAACELEQPRAVGFDVTKNHPQLKTWLEKVRDSCSPYYDEAHFMVNRMAAKAKL